MGKCYKIPANASFIDLLAKGFMENNFHKSGNEVLVILPNKINIAFFRESLIKHASQSFKMPIVTSLLEQDAVNDPFSRFPDFYDQTNEISDNDFKLLIWNLYDKWIANINFSSKTKIVKTAFCKDFISFYHELIESNICEEQFIKIIKNGFYSYYEKLLINFYIFFHRNWAEIKKDQNITTIIEKNNLLIDLKAIKLEYLANFKHIIFAGTTAINNSTKKFVEKILQLENGIFIYHDMFFGYKNSNFNPNYAIKNLIEELKLNEVKFFSQEDQFKTQFKYIECQNYEDEADIIAKKVNESEHKSIIVTNNNELQKLILFKLGKYHDYVRYSDPYLQLQYKFYKFVALYLNNSEKNYIKDLIFRLFSINDSNIPTKIKNITEIYQYLCEISPEFSELDSNFLKHIKIIDKEKSKEEKIKLIKFFTNKPNISFYNDKDILIAKAKDLRLKNFDNIIIADLNQDFWEANIHEIFNSPIIKENFYDIKNLRNSQIANDFLRQLSSKNITFTRSIKGGDKEKNIYYLFKHISSNNIKNFHGENYANIAHSLPQENYEIYVNSKYKKHDFSVTQLEKLISNPYAIYAYKILNLNYEKHFSRESEPQIFGIICHKILELAILHKMDYSDMIEYFSKKLSDYKIRKSLIEAWLKRFEYIAKDFLAATSYTKQILVEYNIENRLVSSDIKIKSQIDRLEISANNKIKIIDYKTGNRPSNLAIKSGLSLQMILTYLLVEKIYNKYDISIEYWILKGKINEAIKYDALDSGFINSMVEHAKERLDVIINNYQASDEAVKAFPDKNNLNIYDDYYHLARQDKL